MRDFPRGVVLIDDLTAMDPGLVAALAPLFGRGTHFPEQLYPHYAEDDPKGNNHRERSEREAPPVSQLLVFITTDLGKQGRTRGKSLQEIEQMVRGSFVGLYGALLPAYTHTFAYLPFNARTAEAVVRGAIAEFPCELADSSFHDAVMASSIDEAAVSFLVQRLRPEWDGRENAHALRRMINHLRAEVLGYLEKHGIDRRIIARFVLDEQAMEVKLQVEGWNNGYGGDL
ncbi:unnamed protein product [Phytomonas sp. Hart1]|nr:unnamed protein product [Phytomonas sp. Hart1]|eukprot:CCW66684.1 unnamed protein product [Phytomonas sp. isolate Hart1]